MPIPDPDCSVLTVHIGPYTLAAIESHNRGPSKASPTDFQEYFLDKDKPSNLGIWRHADTVPQCQEMIRAYRNRTLVEDPHAFVLPKSKRTLQLSRIDTIPKTVLPSDYV